MKSSCNSWRSFAMIRLQPSLTVDPLLARSYKNSLSNSRERVGERGADALLTSSPRRKPVSREFFELWIPAFAGMTEFIWNNRVFFEVHP